MSTRSNWKRRGKARRLKRKPRKSSITVKITVSEAKFYCSMFERACDKCSKRSNVYVSVKMKKKTCF